MSISLDEVRHVARLARLDLDESEIMSLQGKLNSLIGHFSDIEQIDVSHVKPFSHAVSLHNVWGQDIPGPVLSRDQALRNSALQRAGLFVVPVILED